MTELIDVFTVTFQHEIVQKHGCSIFAALAQTHSHPHTYSTRCPHRSTRPSAPSNVPASLLLFKPCVVLCVSGTCMKIKKLGQLYLREEKSRVLHLSSLNAAMETSASVLQPCRPLCYSTSISACARLFFQTKSVLILSSSRQHQRYHKQLDTLGCRH